ncbi:MAG: hypothetical protein ABIE43_01025 [Patescibacteria group bacterium]
MVKKQNATDYGDEIISWQVPEYEKHTRNKSWYIIAIIIALLLMLYSFFNTNFLFAVIIIITAIVIIMHDGQEPAMIKISLTDEGMIVGRKFYDYDDFKNFSIVYKPRQEVKNLYFEFKNSVKPRLSIPLDKQNPLIIRKNLLKYLSEDLDRTDQPLSEGLAKLFKL